MPDHIARPIIALAVGDPAGVSPELTARIVSDRCVQQAAELIVIGDARVLDAGSAIAGVKLSVTRWRPGVHSIDPAASPVIADLANLDPAGVPLGEASAAGGRFALANFRVALALAAAGGADAVVFTPFNKSAMAKALPGYDDEIAVISGALGMQERGREFNILDGLWNARITSHVPLKDVAGLITRDAVVAGIVLTDTCMRRAGVTRPRIAVAGLNPHAGDGGNFGREEIDEIAPAVAIARAKGIVCEGPFPADTVFLRARRGDFDAVQTMYHDQGQIAMKLMGFDRGVTFLGGYPFPITTPAHGTAYDIAGKGAADVGASREAVLLAARMSATISTRQRLNAGARARALTAIVARQLSDTA
jgi:4-hydroxythreonine-4-phosphate dehydrogenase